MTDPLQPQLPQPEHPHAEVPNPVDAQLTEEQGQTEPAVGTLTVVQPVAPGGLAADTLAQTDGVFRTAPLKAVYIYLLGKFERDHVRTQQRLDASLLNSDGLRDELSELRAQNRVLQTRLNFATGLQRSQALLYVLSGAVLGSGISKLPERLGVGYTVVGLVLGFVAWGMRPPRE